MISLERLKKLTPLQKLPKNVEVLGKLIVAKALKSFPKSYKSPNLVTLATIALILTHPPVALACYPSTCLETKKHLLR